MSDDASPARQLLIVRHADAAREPPGGGPDRDRPLTDRGERDARQLGGRLASRGVAADLVLSSPAARAAATARSVAESLRLPAAGLVFEERLYNAALDTLLECLAEIDPAVRRLVLVGHNPGLSDLAAALCADPIPGMPTGAAVCLDFPTLEAWADLRPGRGQLRFRDYGRQSS